MEIVNSTVKPVNNHKFQIAISLRHLTLNLPGNIIQDKNQIKKQRDFLKHKSELTPKYYEKIKRLKTRGYIEKVDPEETLVSGQVWYLPHFST